jgi:hypothetical protein
LRRIILILTLVATAGPAAGQTLDLGIETDRRKRGLSDSSGAASASARIGVDPLPGLNLSAEVALLRESPRHGGATAGIDLIALYRFGQGPVALDFGMMGHLYSGAMADLDYGELHAGASFTLGPASIGASASYAPSQSAIGGDNLYLLAGGDIGLPGSPLTLRGHVGRSNGIVHDPARALRLRPGGAGWDWSIGADYMRGPILLGVTYGAASMARPIPEIPFADRYHSGAVFAARLGYRF